MIVRRIESPGIEINEIDKSLYEKTDYSVVGTTTFVCGFADKGENYKINWINTIQNFTETYGYPTTEEERYFYNAAMAVLESGGVLLASKLPYANVQKDHYTYCDFKLDGYIQINEYENSIDPDLSGYAKLSLLDPSISTLMQIKNDGNGKISLSEYDKLKTSLIALPNNTIRIVNITKQQYEKINITLRDETGTVVLNDQECIGILPVIVSPANALFYQQQLSCDTKILSASAYDDIPSTIKDDPIYDESPILYEKTENIELYLTIVDFKNIGETSRKAYQIENFATSISADSIFDSTVSKLAAENFPLIGLDDKQQLDRTLLKQIGLVVFKMYKDSANGNKINFAVVESYVGALTKNSRDNITKLSLFIEDIVNDNSQYINIFVNCEYNKNFEETDILATLPSVGSSLGFTEKECLKSINYSSSILQPLGTIFDIASDKNKYLIDIIIDAGISNIALKAAKNLEDIRLLLLNNNDDAKIWKVVLQKYDTFVKNYRKDCIFLADGHRGFCLIGNLPIVRDSDPTSSVIKNIIPKLKYMSCLNSSYSAGYCNWFKTYDAFNTYDLIWLPPTILAIKQYLYTDTYYNQWDAPAGMSRGVVDKAIDCAFSPLTDDAGKIYNQQWNYAVNYPLKGVVLEGQKTFLTKRTAFDRINVRRLFLYLEKKVSRIAKYFVYEGNTPFLRQRFVDQIRGIFEDAVQKNGILDYYIKCDETNNTPNVIDNNELHCTIAVKPVKTIEFIVLNFICTNLSANVVESTI